MGARRTEPRPLRYLQVPATATPNQNTSVEKHTLYNKKVETNSIPFCYEYKVSCKYVQSFELFL